MRGERLSPMEVVAEGLADVSNAIVTGEAEIDEHRWNPERCQLPGERDAIRELIVGRDAERDTLIDRSEGGAGLVQGTLDTFVIGAARWGRRSSWGVLIRSSRCWRPG